MKMKMKKKTMKRNSKIYSGYLRACREGYKNITIKPWQRPCITTDGRLFISDQFIEGYKGYDYHDGYVEVTRGTWEYVEGCIQTKIQYDEAGMYPIIVVKVPFKRKSFNITDIQCHYILEEEKQIDYLYDDYYDPLFYEPDRRQYNSNGY